MRASLKILLIALTTILFTWVSTTIMIHGYKHYYAGTYKKVNTLFHDSTRFDMLYLGSSRIFNHLNPRIVDSVLSLNTYNAGRNGAGPFEYTMILQAYLEKHPSPSYLLVSVDRSLVHGEFRIPYPVEYFSALDNRYIYKALDENGSRPWIYKYFPSLFVTTWDGFLRAAALRGLMGRVDSSTFVYYKGYIPLGTFESLNAVNAKASDTYSKSMMLIGRQKLEELLIICRAHHIKPVLTLSMEFNDGTLPAQVNTSSTVHYLQHLSTTYSIPFLRYDSISLARDPYKFVNRYHLSEEGATEYSKIISGDLKKLLEHY